MGGLTFEKLLIVLVIALIILGPERLPVYAQKLGELVKTIKRMSEGAKDRVKEEMGEDFDDVDWQKLDPRQYDPRRIIRDALIEEEVSPEARRARAVAASRQMQARRGERGSAVAAGVAGAASAAGAARAHGGTYTPESFYFDEEAT